MATEFSPFMKGGIDLIKKIEKAKTGDQTEEEGQPGTSSLKRKEFQWDDIIKWLVAAIFGLTLLNLSTDFFRDYTVTCYAPNITSRDTTAYINNYCYSSMPRSEYFTLFIIVQGFLIIGPHILWKTAFESNYNFFFDLVSNLDRLRDSHSGEFSMKNFKIVTRLENELSRTIPLALLSKVITIPPIYGGYLTKLVLQLIAAISSVIFCTTFYVDFSEMFTCPTPSLQVDVIDDEHKWPLLNEVVTCVYPSLRFLSLLRYGDLILLFFIILSLLFGLLWTLTRHPEELGCMTVATFSAQSNFHRDSYRPKSFLKSPFKPFIKSDIDFLLLSLYQASSGQGATFKQIQVSQEMKRQYNRNSELLQLIVTHKVQMCDSKYESEQAGLENAPIYRHTEAMELYGRAGFKWPVKIDFHGSPRFEVEDKHRSELGLAEDREQVPNSIELKAIANHLSSVSNNSEEVFHEFFNKLFSKTGVTPNYTNITISEDTSSLELQTHTGSPQYTRLPRGRAITFKTYYKMLTQWTSKGSSSIRLLRDTLNELEHEEIAEKLLSGELGNRKPNIQKDKSFQNRLYGFLQLVRPHRADYEHRRLAVDISFDGIGCSFILAWAFETVCVLNFDSHFRANIKAVKEDRFLNQVKIITLPVDYYSLPANKDDNFDKCLENIFFMCKPENPERRDERRRGKDDRGDQYVNLFTVGPVSDDSKRVTVNLLLERFNTSSDIANNCLMLAIRPLQINGTDVRKHFLPYIPPLDLFRSIENEEDPIEGATPSGSIKTMSHLRTAIGESSYHRVGTDEGILCYCGDVECIVEMKLYRYYSRRLCDMQV